MGKRFVIFSLVIVASYLAFGEQILASQISTPDSFLAKLGTGIGNLISGIASKIGLIIAG